MLCLHNLHPDINEYLLATHLRRDINSDKMLHQVFVVVAENSFYHSKYC